VRRVKVKRTGQMEILLPCTVSPVYRGSISVGVAGMVLQAWSYRVNLLFQVAAPQEYLFRRKFCCFNGFRGNSMTGKCTGDTDFATVGVFTFDKVRGSPVIDHCTSPVGQDGPLKLYWLPEYLGFNRDSTPPPDA
jgi:hypothetical protein